MTCHETDIFQVLLMSNSKVNLQRIFTSSTLNFKAFKFKAELQ